MRSVCRRAILAFSLPILTLVALPAAAQTGGWRPPADSPDRYGDNSGAASNAPSNNGAAGAAPITPVAPNAAPAPTRARVSKGSGSLSNNQGQVWREYDISPYTSRVTSTNRPEQLIVDWILRETGYETWHSSADSVLNADRNTLRVYQTAEIQAVVADIVDRFVNTQADAYAFSIRIATVVNPNWRAKALPIMTPIPVQTPGIQGWIMHKEDARLLVAEMSRRTDYREFNSPQQLISNGQSIVISTMRPRQYVRGAVATQASWPGYQPEMGTLEEGFSLEFSPLLSLDLASADAVVKLKLNQVEKLVPVKLDLPTTIAPNQRVSVDVPQITMANMHERFRWPSDQVLLLSMGVVATPAPIKDNPITDTINSAIPMLKDPPRADALLLVECRHTQTPSHNPEVVRAASLPTNSFHGRY